MDAETWKALGVVALACVIWFAVCWYAERRTKRDRLRLLVWGRLEVMYARGQFNTVYVKRGSAMADLLRLDFASPPLDPYIAVEVAIPDLDPEACLPYVRSWLQYRGLA